jgi:glycosyltransferase involved in cell wall biosynthesis
MPVFNAEKYIASAIDSILQQTFANWELLVIDDGSNDNTLSVIKTYLSDNRIRIFKSSFNRGLSYSRKLAIEHASGDYIFFMDADDIAMPKRIEMQLAAFRNDSTVVVCGTQASVIDVEGRCVGEMLKPRVSAEIKANIFFGYPFVTPSLAFRSNELKRVSVAIKDEVFEMADDYILVSQLMDDGAFLNLKEKLLLYRIHNSTERITSDANSVHIVNGRMIAWRHLLGLLQLPAPEIAVLHLHDKLSYYRDRLTTDDLCAAGAYVKLLRQIKEQNRIISIFDQDFLASEISSRVYSLLIHGKLSPQDAGQLYVAYSDLLLLPALMKVPVKRFRRWLLRIPN